MNPSLLAFLVIFAAALIQGTAGFGFALLAVPFLSLFLPLETIVPLVVIMSTVTNLFVAATSWRKLRLKEVWPLILFGFIGVPLGVYVLVFLNGEILKLIMGVIILITVAVLIKGYRVALRRKLPAFAAAGLASGILNGALSMSGPPIVIFLSNEGYDRDSFRANLTFYGLLTNLLALAGYGNRGLLTDDLGILVLYNGAALLLGTGAGLLLARRFGEEKFRWFVFGLLAVSGVSVVVKSGLQLL